MLAVLAVTLKELEATVDVRPLPDAVSVKPVAAVLMVMPLNVARPLAVLAVAPPLMVPEDGVSVMSVPVVETGLPNWSSARTVTAGDMLKPAVAFEGCCTHTSCFCAAATTANVVEEPLTRAGVVDAAVKLSPVAAVLIATGNDARPEPFVDAVAPALITPAEGVRVIEIPLVLTGLPNWSCTCTVTEGDIATPATTLDCGC